MSSCESKPVLSKQEVNALAQEGLNGIDPRFLKESGTEAFIGNELLVKGALEAGVSLITGYPGSPVSDVFEVVSNIAPLLAEKGIVAQIANNENLSAARLNGARQAGLRAMAVMKSVGFHVGSDALAVGNLMETRNRNGGAVVVVGDDPWNETTQINSDSRYLSQHLHMPILEPSTFQEVKDWLKHAFDLSGISDLYITYLITTNLADGGGTVKVHPHPELLINRNKKTQLFSEKIKLSDNVLIPPHTSMREKTLSDRRKRLISHVRELGLNKWFGPRGKKYAVGFVTSGLSYGYLKEVLELLGLWNELPVLKMGMTYPLDEELVLEMAHSARHVVVVEEKRGFLESQVSDIFLKFHQEGKIPELPAIWGKNFPDGAPGFPSDRGLNVSIILENLGPAFLRWKKYFKKLQVDRVERELREIVNTRSASYSVPLRTPTFCPGCPHRDSAAANLAVKKKFSKNPKPMDIIFHGESGCHSMLQFAPNEGLMQNYSGMGVGGGTGAGMSPFVENKQVVFLGDGTFFHSGIIAVSDSLQYNQDITYIILENKTTAMTGHQPTPANEEDIMGRPIQMQNIEKILKGMIPQGLYLKRLNPGDRGSYQALLEKTIVKPGVKVIIADKECAITLHRRLNEQRKKLIKDQGFVAREEKINISPDVCEYCLECTRGTGCPGLTVVETAYGPKISTDLSTCVDDGACARTKACPSFEKVVITRRAPPQKNVFNGFDLTQLPAPRPAEFPNRWTAYTAGVGGMGAGIVSAVLVRAGMADGYEVSFLDKKGLAIRNGGVYGHVVFSKEGPVQCPVIPYGKADLLIGLDILEAARALDGQMNLRVAHPARTQAIINTHKNETVLSLMGQQEFDARKLVEVIQKKIRLGGFVKADFAELSERILGSKIYSNMMILGAAYQKGWLPVTEKSLLGAIDLTVRKSDRNSNHQAFMIGRYLILHPEELHPAPTHEDYDALVEKKMGYLKKRSWFKGQRWARYYQKIMTQADRWFDIPKESKLLLAKTVYDLICYGGNRLAEKYISLVWSVYQKDQKRFGNKATQAVIFNLFKTMAIKDEIWVAKLLTSPEKYERDQERYKIDPKKGDRISYVHFNRPQFVIGRWKIEFDVLTRDWMLWLMSRAGFLRSFMPHWHIKEKKFLRWYMDLVGQFTFFESEENYSSYVEALKVPDMVKGYRDIRYPLMDKAKAVARAYLDDIQKREARKVIIPTGQKTPVHPA